MKQHRIDIAATIIIILTGLFFLALAWQIESSGFQTEAEALVGPAMVPIIIAVTIIGLGILELLISMLAGKRTGAASGSLEDSEVDEEFAAFSTRLIMRITAVTGIGFAYVWLLSATGYIISTVIVLAALLALFGTRSIVTIVIVSISGTAAYYLIFIRLMGVYDPAGWLINIG